jgi:hypothetical protein
VVEGDASGRRKPERKSFYAAIAHTLDPDDSEEVLISAEQSEWRLRHGVSGSK